MSLSTSHLYLTEETTDVIKQKRAKHFQDNLRQGELAPAVLFSKIVENEAQHQTSHKSINIPKHPSHIPLVDVSNASSSSVNFSSAGGRHPSTS